MIFYNDEKTLSSKRDLEFRLTPKDKLVFTMLMGGG